MISKSAYSEYTYYLKNQTDRGLEIFEEKYTSPNGIYKDLYDLCIEEWRNRKIKIMVKLLWNL